jgi:hypothetical protein
MTKESFLIRNRQKPFLWLLSCFLCLLTLLGGCVRYDVGVNYHNQHNGTIVQHIKLGDRLASFSEADAREWLKSIESRTFALQGKIKRVSPQEIIVTIPFNNGEELALKFNKFFNPKNRNNSNLESTDNFELVQLASAMTVEQNNLLFLERVHLNLNVDLRALGVLSDRGNLIVSPGSLLDLQFQLNVPWGVNSVVSDNKANFAKNSQGLVWHLQPGQINQIDLIFFIPSAIGIGTVGIIVLMLCSFYLKYRKFPWSRVPHGQSLTVDGN